MNNTARLVSSQKGSALLAVSIISFLFVALVLWASNWARDHSRTAVSLVGSQRALQYADSGVSGATLSLKLPSLAQNLAPGTSTSFSFTMPNGRNDVALYRRSSDTSLVDCYSTGYYFIPTATLADPISGSAAAIAVVNAKFRIANAAEYLMAVPGTLNIAAGLNMCPGNQCSGILYGSMIQFNPATVAGQPPAYVGTVLYATTGGVSYSTPPVSVTYGAGPPQQLSYPPQFFRLGRQHTRHVYAAGIGPGARF